MKRKISDWGCPGEEMNEEVSGGPSADDFTPKAVMRAVRNEALTHPVTLYPLVLGALGGLAGFLFTSPAFLMVGFASVLAGLAGLTVNYFFRDKALAARYTERLKEESARRQELLLREISDDLNGCRTIPGAENHAEQGLDQFAMIQKKYEALRTLVEEKIGGGELELGGIWSASEQVYLGVLDNLRDVVQSLRSVGAIDVAYIESRLKQLGKLKKPEPADIREAETLKKRWKLRESLLAKANDLLTSNEEALTQMEETAVAVSGIRSDDVFTDIDPQTSMDRLRDLAKSIHDKHDGMKA